jgi:large subunit ribosomal protein L15
MKLHNLRPAKGATHKAKRIGRGEASGKGGTSTKGNKGGQSRAGYKSKMGFEGGQMPIQRRVPKRGFKNINRVEQNNRYLNIEDINNNTIDYSTYSIGQIVYIGQINGTGPYCFIPVDITNEEHIAKSFGLVSSVNQPELGNIYVRPFGKVITTLPFSLTNANIGDVLYYDSTNTNGNYTTNIRPASNAIPIYIKISDIS